ncbi:hypothetical protein GJR96_17240 [Haloferax sp. MBLA0076]|uniref:Lipoprotein n=1 Tax=Haloferax litoreum TaxID=2666140 RepID=A0A6A8GM71_9EURY|nr:MULTISPECIES: hypothetical protein [Haloferax]KAB1189923.1 hypothetical protein Hfx1148_17175 [Haloferax sp. CBA1148]MRX23692.1 hypothetical protein [Haloferax litoreum]
MSPTRRLFVRSAAVLSLGFVAGCLGGGGSNGTPTNSDDDTTDLPDTTDTGTDPSGGTRPSGTGGPGITLTDVDSTPDIPIEPTVEVHRDVATDDHPPQLRVTLTNTSDERVEVGEGRAIFFQYVADDSRDLILLPAGQEYPADPGCWRLDEPIAVTEEYRIETFEPGESRSALVDLYGAARDDGEDSCLPVGEYHFETTFAVGDLTGGDEGRTTATWGFSLSLE